jgi:uncharacterized protein
MILFTHRLLGKDNKREGYRVAGKITPWRRKPKIKQLTSDLSTELSFVVIASPDKFARKFHAYKVLQLLKELGAEVYPVSANLDKVDKLKVYPDMLSLPKPVDVVIPCLPASFSISIVEEAKAAGINKVWFQEKTLSEEAVQFCQENDMEIIEGCALMYKDFDVLLKYVNPCFWHYKTFTRKQK